MRPEMARKLGRAIWMQRLRSLGPTAAMLIACTALGGYFFQQKLGRSDPTVALNAVNATVIEAHRATGRASIYIVQVLLDNGGEVQADSTLPTMLHPREQVIVNQARHSSGKLSYHVVQVVN